MNDITYTNFDPRASVNKPAPLDSLYLAGPMRGLPRYNFDAFEEAAKVLKRKGYKVYSPVDGDREAGFDPDGTPIEEFDMDAAIIRDINYILQADGVVLLPGWEKSRGATAEAAVAKWAGKTVLKYNTTPVGPDLLTAPEFDTLPYQIKLPEPDVDILEEALNITKGDRNAQYGDPQQDFKRTAAFWTEIFGVKVEPHQVALAMAALKISRACWSPDKRDHWLDLAGYARCGYLCISRGNIKQ